MEHFNQGDAPGGSSPLARGTLNGSTAFKNAVGLIPARAGNTSQFIRDGTRHRAHPRSRGEHVRVGVARLVDGGSSPLARGTPVRLIHKQVARGLIPARAGNTEQRSCLKNTFRAHPRSRGEHGMRLGCVPGRLGSSPLARGTHLLTWDFTPYISKIESLWSQSLTPEYTISSHY